MHRFACLMRADHPARADRLSAADFLAAEHMTFPDYVDLESERHLRIAASEDTAEAFRAFMEKRPPHFPSTSSTSSTRR